MDGSGKEAWRLEGGDVKQGRPPAPSLSTAINAQPCPRLLSFFVVVGVGMNVPHVLLGTAKHLS